MALEEEGFRQMTHTIVCGKARPKLQVFWDVLLRWTDNILLAQRGVDKNFVRLVPWPAPVACFQHLLPSHIEVRNPSSLVIGIEINKLIHLHVSALLVEWHIILRTTHVSSFPRLVYMFRFHTWATVRLAIFVKGKVEVKTHFCWCCCFMLTGLCVKPFAALSKSSIDVIVIWWWIQIIRVGVVGPVIVWSAKATRWNAPAALMVKVVRQFAVIQAGVSFQHPIDWSFVVHFMPSDGGPTRRTSVAIGISHHLAAWIPEPPVFLSGDISVVCIIEQTPTIPDPDIAENLRDCVEPAECVRTQDCRCIPAREPKDVFEVLECVFTVHLTIWTSSPSGCHVRTNGFVFVTTHHLDFLPVPCSPTRVKTFQPIILVWIIALSEMHMPFANIMREGHVDDEAPRSCELSVIIG
mmetsp:Transcript_158429/g.288925  ORF Transcript_158429/g.288925 Transcript_158429/m.288925 type:complete len:409 (-) Transcript_158429:726-1952(-)